MYFFSGACHGADIPFLTILRFLPSPEEITLEHRLAIIKHNKAWSKFASVG